MVGIHSIEYRTTSILLRHHQAGLFDQLQGNLRLPKSITWSALPIDWAFGSPVNIESEFPETTPSLSNKIRIYIW